MFAPGVLCFGVIPCFLWVHCIISECVAKDPFVSLAGEEEAGSGHHEVGGNNDRSA